MYNTIQTKDYKVFYLEDSPEILIQWNETDRVLPGDVVEQHLHTSKWQVADRAEHPLLVGLLDCTSKYIYGMSSRGTPQYLFTPYNTSYPPFIVGCSTHDRTQNKLVLIRFHSWSTSQKFPKGTLVETLGNAGDFKAEAKALYHQYSPWTFKKEYRPVPVHRAIYAIQEENERDDDDTVTLPSHVNLNDRDKEIDDMPMDLTKMYTFNIDPEGCKDIDDVITIYKRDCNQWSLIITIADVSDVVDVNGDLDLHAAKTGQSLYSHFHPPRNMLPASLAEDRLSLLPGQERQGISLLCHFNGDTYINSLFRTTILQNKCSFTYDTFQKDAPQDIVDAVKRGCAALSGKRSNDPHKWVETCMIHYNTEAAKLLAKYSVGVFRGQTPSQVDRKERYAQICPALAHDAAVYTSVNNLRPHTALGIDVYCYASSPIRRYVDIVNQRLLKSILLKDWYTITMNDGIDMKDLIDQQNRLQKGAKRQSRDDFLLAEISAAPSKVLEGIVFDVAESIQVYIPVWKRIVKVRTWNCTTPSVNDPVTLRYFYNTNQTAWKNKIVFQLVSPTPL